MKILKTDAGMLTDFEVLDMLRARGAQRDPMACIGLVANSECKVYDYLLQRAACNQTREVIESFKRRYEEFKKGNEKRKLTKAELLNIINFRPSSHAELYAVIPNLDARFKVNEDGGSNDVDELLNIVHEMLPPPPQQPEQEAPDHEEGTQNAEAMEQN
ncbi:uncharacterized protein LOC110107324 isoform X1 [Dendrobium catenatum]|uniref:uncharacterized protein LOC110107324 isoform X1 n=2 Tax=Dendrobium catenatum TaxID=906689 RepID=UPI0009F48D11|nr:uncharacterized protein LOC110107324 isoform X1 [Dendrobium catenatum]